MAWSCTEEPWPQAIDFFLYWLEDDALLWEEVVESPDRPSRRDGT